LKGKLDFSTPIDALTFNLYKYTTFSLRKYPNIQNIIFLIHFRYFHIKRERGALKASMEVLLHGKLTTTTSTLHPSILE
jgi:hypothetical protein